MESPQGSFNHAVSTLIRYTTHQNYLETCHTLLIVKGKDEDRPIGTRVNWLVSSHVLQRRVQGSSAAPPNGCPVRAKRGKLLWGQRVTTETHDPTRTKVVASSRFPLGRDSITYVASGTRSTFSSTRKLTSHRTSILGPLTISCAPSPQSISSKNRPPLFVDLNILPRWPLLFVDSPIRWEQLNLRSCC